MNVDNLQLDLLGGAKPAIVEEEVDSALTGDRLRELYRVIQEVMDIHWFSIDLHVLLLFSLFFGVLLGYVHPVCIGLLWLLLRCI